MYHLLVLLQVLVAFVMETVYNLVMLPFHIYLPRLQGLFRLGPFSPPSFSPPNDDGGEAVEVIHSLRYRRGSSGELRRLSSNDQAGAQILGKSSSSSRDLNSMLGKARRMEVRDTNKMTSADWISQSFPDLFWSLTSFVRPEWPVPPPAQRKEIKSQILKAPKVREAIALHSKTNGCSIPQAERQAAKIFEEMACDIRLPIIRGISYILRKVLRLLYPFGINVTVDDLERVKEIARKGTIVYLPCHKSYIDFLVISYICFSHGLPLPHVVSGDNLNIPLLGSILRFGGAFFIRRTFGQDELYKAVFNQYVTQLLVHGNTIECFIEGGRSRSGKVLPPKPGFLRVIIDAVANGDVDDVHVIPISLGYDRIVENDNYIKELTGGEKKAERLMAFLSSSVNLIVKTINKTLCFGQINVGFGEPISVLKYLKQENPKAAAFSNDQLKQLTKNIGYRTLYEINYSNTILTTTLVGTILLIQYGRGMRLEELTKKVKWLRKEVLARGGRVRQETEEEITANLSSAVEKVLETSSHTYSPKKNRLVKRHKDMLMLSLYSPAEQMELALYRNQLIHYFVSEGVVACAMYACEKDAVVSPALVSKQDLFEKVEFLSKLLKLEFVYKPTPAIAETFDQTIISLIRRNVLDQPSEETFCVNESVKDEEAGGTFMYLFLCSLFWPFIESYWLAALCFLRLLPNKICDEKTFIHFAQDVGERLYFEGILDLYEAISGETLQNAITLFESWGIIHFLQIEGQTVHNPGKRVLQLNNEFASAEELEIFIQKLGGYRKKVTAYRSRRFKLRKNDYITDAIQYVKTTIANGCS